MSFSPHQRSPGRRSPRQEELCTGSPCSSGGSWLHCEQLAFHILHTQVWSGSMDPYESFHSSWPALPVWNNSSEDKFIWLQSQVVTWARFNSISISIDSSRLWVRSTRPEGLIGDNNQVGELAWSLHGPQSRNNVIYQTVLFKRFTCDHIPGMWTIRYSYTSTGQWTLLSHLQQNSKSISVPWKAEMIIIFSWP